MTAVITHSGAIYSRITITFTIAVIALAGVVIMISHATSMYRVVMPMFGTGIMRNAAAIVKAMIVVVMVIDHYHTALIPVATAEIKARADINARAPIKTGHKYITARVVPIHGGIISPPPVAINHAGIVSRHIHDALNRGFNHNGFFFADNTHMLDFIEVA